MKLSVLKHYVDAAMDRYGDIECWLDFDQEQEDIYDLEGIFCDINTDDETDVTLVLAAFPVEAKTQLKAVK